MKMNYRFLSKETLTGVARERLLQIASADLSSMTTLQKANLSNEISDIHVSLSSYKGTAPEIEELATECMRQKAAIAESDVRKDESAKARTAEVMRRGIENTPYDIPWMK